MTELEGFGHVVHKVPKVWGAGPITLVGDAAHSMPPTGAHGTNQALEDVWALSRSITGDLRAYERDRARIANRSSSFAGSEMANKPNPMAGIMTDRIATKAYAWLIRRTSGYLLTAS
ncbi:FAD-dependent oxidoreductase [Streptosporangium sp. CA-135522]|uniref:FAD-dependent oxidoreductase n=1 Tax=Streptosporangium sp. CA-135522 TaxID=3240072 RepID=UPI003D908250